MVFDGLKMVNFASLPGMFNRTVSMSTAGKGWAATGWKIGWSLGLNLF